MWACAWASSITIHEPDTWITPYQRYMADGVLPMDSTEARKIKKNSSKFTLIDGELYMLGLIVSKFKRGVN